jgi:hypothetical protein
VISDLVFDFEPDLDDLPPDERAAVLAGEEDEVDLDPTAGGVAPAPSTPEDSP